MQCYIILIFALYLSNLTHGSLQSDNYKLEQLQVLFRHGDRMPDRQEIFPIDPRDEIYQSYGYGQLTKIGKEREYKIGQFLRKRYNDFLGEYKNDDVYAYSSETDRTKMSLQLVLAGLYPPSASNSWNNFINWQPIPTHYEPYATGFLTAAIKCPQFKKLLEESEEKSEIWQLYDKYRNFYHRIENNTGITISKFTTGVSVYNNLRCSLNLGFPLPDWCSKEDFQELEKIAAVVFNLWTSTEQMRRMTAGLVVDRFLKVLNDNNNPKKIHLYGGHDLNIGQFINAHNITGTPMLHEFGSTIVLEKLRGTDGEVYIRFYLWTGVSEKFLPLKIPNCDFTCPLSKYEQIVQSILPNAVSRACTSPSVLCRRRKESNKEIDLDLQLSYLFAGSDLASFKYMKDFSAYTVEKL